jgi:hypothetical protein
LATSTCMALGQTQVAGEIHGRAIALAPNFLV